MEAFEGALGSLGGPLDVIREALGIRRGVLEVLGGPWGGPWVPGGGPGGPLGPPWGAQRATGHIDFLNIGGLGAAQWIKDPYNRRI